MGEQKPQWVKLHIAQQSPYMPQYTIGLLGRETPEFFVLNLVMEHGVTSEGVEGVVHKGVSFIAKQHVWRCEMLSEKPDDFEISQSSEVYGEQDGL